MPTVEQIRAARALIGWSQGDLADQSGLSQTGIARIENGSNQPNSTTIAKITGAFDKADVEFIGESGVKKRTGTVKTLRGKTALKMFLDHVYESICKYGSTETPLKIYLSNVENNNWLKWMSPEDWENHKTRMIEKKDIIDLRIIIKEDDWHMPASEWSSYKWFPESIFNSKSFYSYHNTLAFLNFMDNDLEIMVMEHKEFAEGFRILYETAWDKVAFTPPSKL
jgi:transcriptional regulator with XRE-family HTH domain